MTNRLMFSTESDCQSPALCGSIQSGAIGQSDVVGRSCSRAGLALTRGFRVGVIFLAATLFVAISPLEGSAQQLYVVRGSRGSITFTSTPPQAGANYEVFKPRSISFSFYKGYRSYKKWTPKAIKSDYDQLIVDTADDHSIEPALVKAVVHVESLFNPRARSSKGAMGLMQLMPGTAKRFGVKNAYTPSENIGAGAQYLKFLLKRYDGNESLALAAYNAGEGCVDSYGRIPPYQETQNYVRRVLKVRELYRCVDAGKKGCASS
jgi:hypothetical protein